MCLALASAAPVRRAVSGAADPAAAAVPGRRRGGPRRPPGDRAHGGRPRTAVRDREQGGRRRRHRHRRDGQGASRRLHAAAHHAQPHHQRGAQSEAALRHREGPRAGRDRGGGAGIAGEPSGGAVHDLRRLHRLREEESGQAQLLLGRQRHAAARHHGVAAAANRHCGHPHSLSRRGAGDDRSPVRAGAAQDGHLRHGKPARGAGQAARARIREP